MKNNSEAEELNDTPEKDDLSLDPGTKTTFTSKLVKKTMTEQLISPPTYLWDKIERVLDQQQHHREAGSEIIAASLKKARANKKNLLLAAAGATAVASLLWFFF
jgi:hypothetical protein